MLQTKTTWRSSLPAGLALALAGCAEDSTEAANDYTVLLNDDDIQGKAGRYALTARAGFAAPLAVVDVAALTASGSSHSGRRTTERIGPFVG